MNKKILFLAGIVFMAGSMLTGCQTSVKKVENARDKVREANNAAAWAQMELNQAICDSLADYEQFKKEFEAKIMINEKHIAEFKTQRAIQKKENLSRYEQKLAGLEQKNTDMKKKLEK